MAGQNSIAKANVMVTASADDLKSGLDGIKGDLNKFGKDVAKPKSNGFFADMFGLSKGQTAAVAAGIGATILTVKEGLETLTDISKQGAIANAMGLTSEQFTGMAGVAKSVGEDTREFIESLVTMGKLGTDAAKGTEDASDAFKTLGLNANDFIKLRADEQFFSIFEALSKVEDPLKKTRALMKAFGEDGGKYLQPLLEKTPQQMREMAKAFEISGEEMKRSRAATSAIKGVELAFGKVWRTIVIGAAPFVQFVATIAEKIIRFFEPAFNFLSKAFTTVWDLGVTAWEGISAAASSAWGAVWPVVEPVFKYISDGFDAILEVATYAWEGIKSVALPVLKDITDWIVAAIAEVADWAGAFAAFGDGIPPIRVVVIELFRNFAMGAAYAWDALKIGVGVFSYVFSYMIDGLADFVRLFKESIKELVRTSAQLAYGLGNNRLGDKLFGVYMNVDKASDKMKDAAQSMRDWAIGTAVDFGSTAERVSRWIDKLYNQKGIPSPAAVKPPPPIQNDPVSLAKAIERGSADAYSMIVRNRYGVDGKDHAARTAKATEKTAAATTRTAKGVEGLAAAIANIGSV